MCSNFFQKIVRYEIMWKNIAEPPRSQITIRRMRIACRITKVTDTQSKYVICLLLFHPNNGCTNAPEYYGIRKLAVSLWTISPGNMHRLPCLLPVNSLTVILTSINVLLSVMANH